MLPLEQPAATSGNDRIIDLSMSLILRFGTRKAILYGARWTSADAQLESILNHATRQWLEETGGPPSGDADPDLTTARVVGFAHGGRIYRHLQSGKKAAREAYVNARQLSLFAAAAPASSSPKRPLSRFP